MANPWSFDATQVPVGDRQRMLDYYLWRTGPTQEQLWDKDGDGNFVQPNNTRLIEIILQKQWRDDREAAEQREIQVLKDAQSVTPIAE